MPLQVRVATADDLDVVAELTARERRQRAEWAPEYFRPAAGADERHRNHLAELLDSPDVVARVVTDDGAVVGCAFAEQRDGHWFVDNVAAADEGWWSDAMVELVRAVEQRPAFTCAPRQDIRRLGCFTTVGLRHRSSYWRLAAAAGDGTAATGDVTAGGAPEQLPAAPLHSFTAIDPNDPAVTVLADDSAGYALLAPPLPAPAVYDPGGNTGLVDRVTGGRRGELVDAAIAESRSRGDVQLVVVCAEDDPVLEDALVDRGFGRVVDVYSWPTRPLF